MLLLHPQQDPRSFGLCLPPPRPCRLEQLELTSRDCEQLMPQSLAEAEARVMALSEELARVDNDIVESEAKNELCKLLEIRTQ